MQTAWASFYTVSFNPGGKYLATGDTHGRRSKASLWEVTRGTKVQQMEHEGSVNAVSFSPEGKYLATGDSNKNSESLGSEQWSESSADRTCRHWSMRLALVLMGNISRLAEAIRQ